MEKIKVFIDAGHGGRDSGATNLDGSVLEKDIVLSVANKLNNLLINCGYFEVMLTRTNDITCSLSYRSDNANKWGADIFVSIHCNSSKNHNGFGIETYAYSEKYKKLATFIHSSLIECGIYSQDRGVKYADYHVLRETNMNACLVELGFIDIQKDLDILLTNQDNFAKAIYKGILNYYNLIDNTKNDKLYKVVVDSYRIKENANKRVEELREQGIKSFIMEVDE